MKIQEYCVSLKSSSEHVRNYSKQEKIQFWANGSSQQESPATVNLQDTVEISEESKSFQSKLKKVSGSKDEFEIEISEKDRQKLLLLQKMLETLTGKKFKFVVCNRISIKNPNLKIPSESQGQMSQPLSGRQGWGLIYEMNESYNEKESMSFSASAQIIASDGRKISVDIAVNISREFAYANNISFRAGDAAKIDPLVINVDALCADLSDKKIFFDLDIDGKLDSISFPVFGSGFLAIDRNQDGLINDGSELFGAKLGDGFAELAMYDSDLNGWIDENDPVFDNLLIWMKDESGSDKLYSLRQKNIGAIYLGSVKSNYSIANQNNMQKGVIRKTGIFIKEDGRAGTLQHIDICL